jgi:hypothetical protein
MKPMGRLSLFVTVIFSIYAIACGSSNNTTILPPPPPPPGVNFSNGSLNGQFAFSMSGTDFCGGLNTLLTRAGSFTADGSGHITAGVEDVNDACIGAGTLTFTSSSYSIQADGRGTLSLTNSSGTTHYAISLSTTSKGFIVQMDANDSASGSFQKQDTTAFSATKVTGGYVFDVNGADIIGVPESIIGRFNADGVGGINLGLFDSNDNGVLSGQQSFNGSYLLDPTFGSSGRFTATVAGHTFAFYVVDATRLKFVGTNPNETLSGDAQAQGATPFTLASVNGNFVLLIGGESSTGGPVATAGRFGADGAGNVTLNSVFLDENNNGGVTSLPAGTVSGTYTVDGNGLGGGTLTIVDTTKGTFTFIFYLASPTHAVLQETDPGIVSDGSFLAQTASTINAALVNGNYSFNWTGVDANGEEDFSGEFNLSNASPSAVMGTTDFNELANINLSAKEQLFFNIPTTGTLTFAANPAARNSFPVSVNIPGTPVTIRINAYVVDGNTIFLVGDIGPNSTRVILGTAVRQP